MRFLRLLLVILVVSASLVTLQSRSAYAFFHCIRIHAVMAGYNGANSSQYVELRMFAVGQALIGGLVLKFYEASGTLKATFTFPTDVANFFPGESILVGTQQFDANTTGGNADFTFTNGNTAGSNGGDPLHPVQSTGGKVTFGEGAINCNSDLLGEIDSLAYGGATADYGSAAPALPSPSDKRALRLNNLNPKPSNNSTEYSLSAVATSSFAVTSGNLSTDFSTPRNNSRTVLEMTSPVGGIAELPGVAEAPLAQPDSSGGNVVALAVVMAATVAGALTLAGAAWYARKRWLP